MPCRSKSRDKPDASELTVGKGEIRFADVTFQYQGKATPLFKDFSLKIAGGERVGLVGAFGLGQDDLRQSSSSGSTMSRTVPS